jgi:C-terminal processing protease CtpA/Prc
LRKITGRGEFDRGVFYSYLSEQKNIRFSPLAMWDLKHPGAYFLIKDFHEALPHNMKYTRFTGKTVFLINECTQSSMESVALAARINFHATLIGRPTSGALGRVVWIPVSYRNNAMFSGAALLSLDGTELQRKGIAPDIEVYPTMESIKEGKDEILEAAIEYLNNY